MHTHTHIVLIYRTETLNTIAENIYLTHTRTHPDTPLPPPPPPPPPPPLTLPSLASSIQTHTDMFVCSQVHISVGARRLWTTQLACLHSLIGRAGKHRPPPPTPYPLPLLHPHLACPASISTPHPHHPHTTTTSPPPLFLAYLPINEQCFLHEGKHYGYQPTETVKRG